MSTTPEKHRESRTADINMKGNVKVCACKGGGVGVGVVVVTYPFVVVCVERQAEEVRGIFRGAVRLRPLPMLNVIQAKS